MPKPRKAYSKRKVVGRRATNALVLFGLPQGKRMESPEQRILVATILSNSDDERMRRLARCLMDPAQHMRSCSLATHAEGCKVNGYMIADELRKAYRTEGLVEQAKLLPAVMKQTAEDAMSRWEDCETCEGAGKVPDADAIAKAAATGEHLDSTPMKRCKRCKGKGTVYIQGDIDNRKLLFETHGLTSKGGGGALNVLNINNAGQPAETLHSLAESLGPILEGEAK